MGMKVKLIGAWIALALALASCSGPLAPAPPAEQPPPPPGMQGPPRLLAGDLSLTCDAAFLSRCDADGCMHEAGAQPSVPLSFSYDGATGDGSLCIATGCAAAMIVAVPGTPAGEGEDLSGLILSAPMSLNEASGEMVAGEPELFDGVVSLARDGSRFRIVQQSAGGVSIWGGSCGPQGE